MKKKNKNGFFLSETMIVMAIVAVVLLAVFKIFSSTYIKYKESENYDTTNALNTASILMQYYSSKDIKAGDLLDNAYYIELTSNATFNNAHYTNLKAMLNVKKIYLFDMVSLYENNNINNFDLQLRNYLKKLQNKNYKYAIVVSLKNGEYTSLKVDIPKTPVLIGDESDEYNVVVPLGSPFVDPGYINWNGDNPTITGTINKNIEGIYYLNYDFDGYKIRRKVTVIQKTTSYSYTGTAQEFIVPETGWYEIELWGAEGGWARDSTTYSGGKGGYTSGKIQLTKGEKLYIYVGGKGSAHNGTDTDTIIEYGLGYNGGSTGYFNEGHSSAGGGGGATDVRYGGNSLNDRIMVAGGGGGGMVHQNAPNYSDNGGAGGGLSGIEATATNLAYCYNYGMGGTQKSSPPPTTCTNRVAQTSNGGFGIGATNLLAGGGGGYYGGSAGKYAGAGGGSSYISGHTGSIAIVSKTSTASRTGTDNAPCGLNTSDNLCSIHYCGKKFINTLMIDGNGYTWTNTKQDQNNLMPNPVGGYLATGFGRVGNGYARIKYLGGNFTYSSNEVYNEPILNGAYPRLDEGMIPVTISNTGVVTTVDPKSSSWYRYEAKQWANVVLVKERGTKTREYYKHNYGVTINEEDIYAYLVWIPRYKYKLFNVEGTGGTSPQSILITFENAYTTKSINTTNATYLTHPAFTYGGKELNGIWVGKFETTGNSTTPEIKPNVAQLSAKLSVEFTSSLKFGTNSKYGITSESRMSKNSDWGAIMYLSHSTFGIGTEIRINNYRNNSKQLTGCGASTADEAESTTCGIPYGASSANGVFPQSTTGNIYGIFDMSGGSYEHQMGVLGDLDGNAMSGLCDVSNSGYKGLYGDKTYTGCDGITEANTTGLNLPDEKYYKIYENDTTNWKSDTNHLGEAIGETRGWYSDSQYIIYANAPWFVRGGVYSYKEKSGGFSIQRVNGNSTSNISFRTIITTY